MDKFTKVFNEQTIRDAWLKVKSKGKGGGIDNISIDEFENDLEKNLKSLLAEVISRQYVPEPYKLFYLQKANKEKKEYRPIGLLTIRDKIVQHCVYQFYSFSFDKIFLDSSYAYRQTKSHQKAINRIQDYIKRKFRFAALMDIKSFFDTIDRKLLFEVSKEWFNDPFINELVQMWVITGFVYNDRYIRGQKGIAQGGVLSPLLSNIYLHSFDLFMRKEKIENVRYADNIAIFGRTKEGTLILRQKANAFLTTKLNLTLNVSPEEIEDVSQGIIFCGIHFHDGNRTIAPAKMKKIIDEHRKTVETTDLRMLPYKLKESIEGIKRYYAPFDTKEQIEEIRNNLVEAFASKINMALEGKQIRNFFAIKSTLVKLPSLYKDDIQNKNFINDIFKKIQNGVTDKQPEKSVKSAESPVQATFNERLGSSPNAPGETSTSETQKSAEKKVEKKRKIYYNKFVQSLDILVTGNHAQIGKAGEKIVIRKEGKVVKEAFANKIGSIIINAHGTTISADAVKLCISNNVLINYFDDLGRPFATIYPTTTPTLSVASAQAEASKGEKGKTVVKLLIHAKIQNQISLIKFLTKNKQLPEEESDIFKRSVDEMNNLASDVKKLDTSLQLETFKHKIFGFEGSAAVSYWSLFKLLINDMYLFEKREHQGSTDTINQMLNYGYGILYSKVVNAAVVAGLNPNSGFLHSDQKGKPVLSFDLIEPFRPVVVDRAVLAILSRKVKIPKESPKLEDGLRQLLTQKVLARLYTEIKHHGERISVNDLIHDQAKQLADFLTGNEKYFRPYLSKW